MRILIDEDLDIRLRHLFPHDETYTVEYMGWKSVPNGELLAKADAAGFALMITGDKSINDQQNRDLLSIQVVAIEKSPLTDDAYIADLPGMVDLYHR